MNIIIRENSNSSSSCWESKCARITVNNTSSRI
ncbi:MAG TPA: hypothetical protein [Caudoviricetes sp.]|nr:MAG TPA: hypothetical protein [Caudoviricetes sp.]